MSVTKKQTIQRSVRSNRLPSIRNINKSWTVLLILLLGVALLLVGAVSSIDNKANPEYSEQIRYMGEYLNKQYGKNFIVTNYRVEGSGLGMAGTEVAIAKPNDDQELTFKVYREPSGRFRDNYVGAIWSREESSRIGPLIDQLFDQGTIADVNIETDGTVELQGLVPDFQSGIEKYNKSVRYKLTITGPEADPIMLDRLSIANSLIELRKRLPLVNATATVGYFIHLNETHFYGLSLTGEELNEVNIPDELVYQFRDFRRATL